MFARAVANGCGGAIQSHGVIRSGSSPRSSRSSPNINNTAGPVRDAERRRVRALPPGVPRGQSGPNLVAFTGLLMGHFRQRKRREWRWTFVDHEGIEPTNNTAERALRPAVIYRKLSFGTQSESGPPRRASSNASSPSRKPVASKTVRSTTTLSLPFKLISNNSRFRHCCRARQRLRRVAHHPGQATGGRNLPASRDGWNWPARGLRKTAPVDGCSGTRRKLT